MPPTADDIINSMKPEELPKPKDDLPTDSLAEEGKGSNWLFYFVNLNV